MNAIAYRRCQAPQETRLQKKPQPFARAHTQGNVPHRIETQSVENGTKENTEKHVVKKLQINPIISYPNSLSLYPHFFHFSEENII